MPVDSDREKWDAYPDTVLRFVPEPSFSVDLRLPVGEGDRHAMALLGLDAPFGIFTAENPEGENAEDAGDPREEAQRERENDHRISALERELSSRGIPFVRVDGTSPDGEYRERCVAALMPRDEAIAFAARYRQLALFWFDGTGFWLLPAYLEDAAELRLPA
jgi:hypothetical protein